MTDLVEAAIDELRRGKPILIFDSDDRERECDMVFLASKITPKKIAMLREEAGGLICVSVHPRIARALGLPFLYEVFRYASGRFPILKLLDPHDIPYDEKSAFSISINHRKTFTGITDRDRAKTILEFSKLAERAMRGENVLEDFGREFRSPGHVILLRAADGLLAERRGHTELSAALAEMTGCVPLAVICEMLDSETGLARSKEDILRYARENDLIYLEGSDIIDWYKAWLKERGGR